MIDPKTKKIIEYYDARVSEHGDVGQSTLLDNNMRVLEIETVQKWLSENDRVLEIFCGNGISTLEYATHCKQVIGCDLSEQMIASAKRNLANRKPLRTNVVFEQRNVLDIDSAYNRNPFDAVVSIRGLINLPSREMQKEAILKVHKLLPKNGKSYLSKVTETASRLLTPSVINTLSSPCQSRGLTTTLRNQI